MTVKDSITIMDAFLKFYSVPEFQRNYSWTEDNDIEQLWNDIIRVKEKKIENYFFGPVLLRDTDDPNTFRIIDGQQRFATVSIFLAVIRDKLWTLGDKEFARDYQQYILGALPGTPIRYRLTMNKTDRDFYKEVVQSTKDPAVKIDELKALHPLKALHESNKLLFECYRYFNSAIDKFVGNNVSSKLLELANVVLQNFRIFPILVDDETDAYRVFTSINAKGLDLAISDLIKVHLYSVAENYLPDVQYAWETMLYNLQKSNVSDYIRRQWISSKETVSNEDLFDRISQTINEPSDAKKYVEMLRDEAQKYRAIINPYDKESKVLLYSDGDIIQYVSILGKLGSEVTIPVLLSGLKKNMHKNDFKLLAQMCVNIFFRYKTICNRHASDIQEIMSSVALALRSAKGLSLSEITDRFLNINPSDEDFKMMFSVASIKNSSVAKYILTQINQAMEIDPETIPDPDNITLEHIMPQNGKSLSWVHTRKTHKDYVHRLGNLTLLTGKVNKSARDDGFDKKNTKYYKSSKLKINQDLKQNNSWTEKEITDRQDKFAEQAIHIWCL